MTNPAGKLLIQVHADGVGIASTRPVQAARLLVGRGTAQTLHLLPALFSICASAQATAGVTAIEQALALTTDPAVGARRRQLVAVETVREHLWRILLDWPRALSEPPDTAAMAAAMAADAAWRATLTAGGDLLTPAARATVGAAPTTVPARLQLAELGARWVFGLAPDTWLGQVDGLATLVTWAERTETVAARLVRRVLAADWAGLGRCAVDALPELPAPDLERHLAGADPAADAFVARPNWDGQARETSAFTRQLAWPLVLDLTERFGNGLLPRLAAQLTEVARGLAATAGESAPPASAPLPPGVGLAQVQAARGLLVHRVRLADEQIAEYRILAPTEWNFHPQGVVAAGLSGLVQHAAPAELEPLARLFITAVDPCVDFDLNFFTDRLDR
ncbi:nickel-dependent hydrogenase large subunit [uncultured Thiodictyon sp.]|uniref:nickel-dependent hydrogenase large subunit n=1 Tax=uncultured Thiodictyon sp. TaxID=1846217 RepID=UPI0025EF47A7|nr:nickel-dependent hydrogenase large subunit [uncultured Thiodictyon sp.]